ncbi:8-oxo-dGTP diphosphatase [Alkalicoccobacillus porphyridii]|uniref:8-oxo-dGTP diphosphatase n=1 Tax=Alkalicoccobacillus porphyridii TaxID=2597270 RepID=A0A554A3L9_9BACI|nr:8-oxo-dGTP diphosphatase [Alkalicoccobacillus porphyridii]TSB48282.1 8-oxo-dGTP diphosphatase [Alkalicoccobacillus porphyridii]
MQRVTNCTVIKDGKVLLLQKPSRGWWVAPGGKMETGETIKESAIRECREETGFTVKNPELTGVYTMVIEEDGKVISEWMLFTFKGTDYSGTMLEHSPEGELKWWDTDKTNNLPMAEGDRKLMQHSLHGEGIMFGTFYYSPSYELLRSRIDSDPTVKS